MILEIIRVSFLLIYGFRLFYSTLMRCGSELMDRILYRRVKVSKVNTEGSSHLNCHLDQGRCRGQAQTHGHAKASARHGGPKIWLHVNTAILLPQKIDSLNVIKSCLGKVSLAHSAR